jgi:hypothetical protein
MTNMSVLMGLHVIKISMACKIEKWVSYGRTSQNCRDLSFRPVSETDNFLLNFMMSSFEKTTRSYRRGH